MSKKLTPFVSVTHPEVRAPSLMERTPPWSTPTRLSVTWTELTPLVSWTQFASSGPSLTERTPPCTTAIRLGDMSKLETPDASWTQGALSRSEERRVGKECRSRWSPY